MTEYHVDIAQIVTSIVAIILGVIGTVGWWVVILVLLSMMNLRYTWRGK